MESVSTRTVSGTIAAFGPAHLFRLLVADVIPVARVAPIDWEVFRAALILRIRNFPQ